MKRLALVLICSFAVEASAQDINLGRVSTSQPHIAHVHTGLDHAFTATLGYDYVLPLAGRLLLTGAELTLPWAEPDLGDYQLRLTGAAPLLELGGWKLSARLGPTLRGADTAAANMTSLGVDTRFTFGWYAQLGFVAAQLGVDWTATTHITNSDAYRARVYADARDGWYWSTGGTLYAALLGGFSFGRWGVTLRGGVPRALNLDSQTIPFFALIGASYALPL